MHAPAFTATAYGWLLSPVTILLTIAGISYMAAKGMQGEPLEARRMLVLPAALVILGISDLTGKHGPTAADIAFLVAGGALSVLWVPHADRRSSCVPVKASCGDVVDRSPWTGGSC